MAGNLPIYKTQSDDNGNWKLQVKSPTENGMHAAVIVTEDGQRDTILFHVGGKGFESPGTAVEALVQKEISAESHMGTQVNFIPKSTVLNFLWLPIVLLVFFILILVGNTIRLAKKADLTQQEQKRGRYTNHALYLSIAILLGTLFVFLYFDYKSYRNIEKQILPEVRQISDKISPYQAPSSLYGDMKGTILDALELTPVSGVDLSVHEVGIRTGQSGQFQFMQSDNVDGIQLTHSLLPVPIYYDVKSLDDIRLYYNGPMFSALYKIIDMESRQFISQIYETLDPQVKAEKKLEEFVQNYDPLFGKIDFPVGKIVIKNIEIINRKRVLEYDHMYSRLVKIDVIKNSFVRSYYFNFDNGQWTYID